MRFLLMAEPNRGLEMAAPAGEWVPLPAHAMDQAGRLQVRLLIESLASGPAVIVTDRDLATPECSQLFGIADYRRQVAIVSTYRLDDGSATLAGRLRNAIAHEQGHLDGLLHCSQPGCLMKPAQSIADIDSRRLTPCGQCPKRRSLLNNLFRPTLASFAIGFAALAVLVAGVQTILRLATPEFSAPFL